MEAIWGQQAAEGQQGPRALIPGLVLQNVYAPEDDPEMKVEHYERTFDQNEELGLNDMKTEGYETDLAPQR